MEETNLKPANDKQHDLVKEPKMIKDLSSVAELKIPEAKELAKNGKLEEALAILLSFEKQTRVAADSPSNAKVLVSIIEVCYDAKQIKTLEEHLELLSKRRGHLKSAIAKMVEKACEYVDDFTNVEEKLKYIECLRKVTDGKIYVEVSRARLTLKLAYIKENKGQIEEAAKILQELQVETYGSMVRKEKIKFILEQIRLCIATKDFIRTQIISKKISTRMLNKDEYQQEKLKFYKMMIDLSKAERNSLNVCKNYVAIFHSKNVQENENLWKNVVRKAVSFLVLAPYDNEQSDIINRLLVDSRMKYLPVCQELLQSFVQKEVVNWNVFKECFENELKTVGWANDSVLADAASEEVKMSVDDGKFVDPIPPPRITSESADPTSVEEKLEKLHLRVTEHNIRVISEYYTRITFARLVSLLDISPQQTEKHVSNLVVLGQIYAKIDRPNGIITFTKQQRDPEKLLNEWSNNINKLMKLVENSSHLINLARTDAATSKVRA